MGRTLCSQRKSFSNRHSLGHHLMADAVLWDGRGVLKGAVSSREVFLIDTPWGISSWRTLRCQSYAVFS